MLLPNYEATTPIFTDLENPAGCDQIEAVALPIDPLDHCQQGIVQVYAKGGTGVYEYSWEGGAPGTFGSASTAAVPQGNSGYVVVRDNFTGPGGPRIAIARWKIEARPRLQVVFDKRNFCEAANPDESGEFIFKGLIGGQWGDTYTYDLTRTYDAVTNTYGYTPIVSGNLINNPTVPLFIANGLTPGNYNFTINHPDRDCAVNVRFTICNNCAEVSSDHPDQEGGCGCCGGTEDCISDTSVNINLGN